MNIISLFELNGLIKEVLNQSFDERYWVSAEINELHVNKGHCYLELIEKAEEGSTILARQRAMIWSNQYAMLNAYFSSITSRPLGVGMKVLVQVEIAYHESFGLSLTIRDIDPTYTVGDLERQKQEVIRKLSSEGIIDMNRMCAMPSVIQRIALIASATSAGYGDFMGQLNLSKVHIQVTLFPAVMQGEGAVASLLDALDQVNNRIDEFDALVMIRGGGATSDLHCYNDYVLTASVAQFPIPVITGIGHERDITITDMVAHTPLKTPTAVSDFLIQNALAFLDQLLNVEQRMHYLVQSFFNHEHHRIQTRMLQVLPVVSSSLLEHRHLVDRRQERMQRTVEKLFGDRQMALQAVSDRLYRNVGRTLERQHARLDACAIQCRLLHPERVLERGYALVTRQGHVITDVLQVHANDELQIKMRKGILDVQVMDNHSLNSQ